MQEGLWEGRLAGIQCHGGGKYSPRGCIRIWAVSQCESYDYITILMPINDEKATETEICNPLAYPLNLI